MLGTYFAIILLMFIVMIVGAVFGYSQSLDELKKPLVDSMSKYNPEDDASADQKAITTAWDQVQNDVSAEKTGTIVSHSRSGGLSGLS